MLEAVLVLLAIMPDPDQGDIINMHFERVEEVGSFAVAGGDMQGPRFCLWACSGLLCLRMVLS